MPKLNQPESLEKLCLKNTAEWVRNVGKNLIPVVAKLSATEHKSANIELNRIVEIVRDCFERYVPFTLYQNLTDQVVKAIAELVKYYQTTETIFQINIAVRLSEALISRKQRIIDFEKFPKMIRSTLYDQMSEMDGLEYLNMGSVSGGWKTFENEQLVMNGLSDMRNLRKLTLSYDCTDRILRLLARNCLKLEYLDIRESKNINNESVYLIQDLKMLQYLQVFRTNVTMEGVIFFLLNLPELTDIGRYDELACCLECIDDYHPAHGNFALKQFTSNCCTTKQMKILCEKCPNIESVSLFYNVLFLDLLTIVGLNKLSKLKLQSCDFFSDHVKSVLEVKGCNITFLNLEHVDEIDMNALMYISEFCPDLKTLILCNCVMLDSTSNNQRHLIPPFMNLENFTLVGNCNFKQIEFILCNAYKIKFIHFGTHISTDDMLFEKIFLHNALEYLEELQILHSDYLTIKTAYDLIKNCNNLTKLFELENWLNVTPLKLDELKEYIKQHNLDVDLTSYRKQVT
jgi:ribonuclease P/MRP protein subunit RPP40